MDNDNSRRIRGRAVAAYPGVSAALVVSVALALTPFGTSQVMALEVTPAPLATTSSTPPLPTPTPTPTPTPPRTPTPTATPTASSVPRPIAPADAAAPAPIAVPSASSGRPVAQGIPGDHHLLARIEGPGIPATYLPVDAPMTDTSRFETIRVRFRLHNAGAVPITARPRLEYRPDGSAGYIVVPEQSMRGIPLSVDREWVQSPGGGTRQGPLGADIPVARFLTGNVAGSLAMTGHHSMGANPAQELTLPPDSYTEQEFSVRLTTDAIYGSGYDLRVTDGHAVLSGTKIAKLRLGPPPVMRLSAGQRNGLAVESPRPAHGRGSVK